MKWRDAALGFVATLIIWQLLISDTVLQAFGVYENANDFRGFSAYFPPLIYVLGNFLMILFVLWKRADMRRWFLAKS